MLTTTTHIIPHLNQISDLFSFATCNANETCLVVMKCVANMSVIKRTSSPCKYMITIICLFMFLHYLQVRARVDVVSVSAAALGEERQRGGVGSVT